MSCKTYKSCALSCFWSEYFLTATEIITRNPSIAHCNSKSFDYEIKIICIVSPLSLKNGVIWASLKIIYINQPGF